MPPPRTHSLTVAGPVGPLEVLIDEPADVAPIHRVALICHPHPLFGGTMTNKVAHILAKTCAALKAPAVRFNFRGVGRSDGVHDDGRGETEDALAMLQWMANRWPGVPIWLTGFSFGAAVALRASLHFPVDRLVTVAPAVRWLQQLKTPPACPWLVVQGDRDELVDVQAVQAWIQGLASPPELRIMAGAEHFFHGRLSELQDIVAQWLGQDEDSVPQK